VKPFTLRLQDATRSEDFDDVTGFVGEDSSGSFAILADHERFITVLILGLARFRVGESSWSYLALPGAVVYFRDNLLTVNTRRYLLDEDYHRISTALQQQLLQEEDSLHTMKSSLRRLEDEFLKRMWEMGRRAGPRL